MTETVREGFRCFELSAEDVRGAFPERERESNKSDFGYVALVGGDLLWRKAAAGKPAEA